MLRIRRDPVLDGFSTKPLLVIPSAKAAAAVANQPPAEWGGRWSVVRLDIEIGKQLSPPMIV
jgi:hypothetical protein